MQLNSYLYPSSFRQATNEELQHCFSEINDVVSSRMLVPVNYMYSDALNNIAVAGGQALANVIYSFDDKDLSVKVIPQLLRQFKFCKKDYSNIEELQTDYKSDLNSLWGIHFNPKEPYCLTTATECTSYIESCLQENLTSANFQKLSSVMFPHIVICDNAMQSICALGNSKNFGIICEDLNKLEQYCSSWESGAFQLSILKDNFAINTSDESDTTKQDPRLASARQFTLKGLGPIHCFLHIKHGDFRIHYYPDAATHQIHIGYIGRHLPTKLF